MKQNIVKKLVEICIVDGNINPENFNTTLEYLAKTDVSLLSEFKMQINKYIETKTLQIISAINLNDSQRSRIQSRFPGYFYEYIEDKDILGGLIIKMYNYVYDDSFSSKINQLQ